MQIYVMNGDGSGVTRITYSGANDDYPRWSPNGALILFQSDRDHPDTGYRDIYLMSSVGTGVTRLTSDGNDNSLASLSPDGSKVVFQSTPDGVNYQLCVLNMGVDVGNLMCLSEGGEPSWSPDGSKIAFASDRDHVGYRSIYVMNTNGSNQQRLTFSASTVDDSQPVWSPNGSKIAFVSTRDSVLEQWQETDDFEIPEDDGQVVTKSKLHINKEIYVMNANGSGQTRLTNELANDDAPAWSPDGSRIVFRSDRERDCCDPMAQVWTMNADGTSPADLSNSGNGDYAASWISSNSNQTPVANAGGTYSGTISQNVPFNGGSSYDPDGTIANYSWTFGDGGTGSGVAPTHAYTGTGTYTVTLTVTDNLGAQASASSTVSISSSSGDQFAQSFLQFGLGRAPNGNESTYWTDIMRSAYPQGQSSMLLAMTEFGMTVFESAEYAARGRNDHDFVYDLYKTYLMREPDQEGWDWWTGRVPSIGRAQVRNGFEESIEFHNIVANLAASGNPSSAVSSLATARVDLFNQSGNQVQARDCEWSVPLVSLPGRAGMDLGLSVSYSSLVWTRSGPYAYFGPDNESLSPGFKIGFPSVSWRVFDAQTARNVYVFSAGGRHVELRQVGTSTLYEAADSSYLQLTDFGSSLLVRSTDGTQIRYEAKANGWQANEVKDRNGNLLVISNDWRGDIQNITDTVGRVIRFNYDGNANLTSVTQDGWAQPWATFGWGSVTLQPTLSLQVVGVSNGEMIPALTQVNLIDGSHYNFEYTSNAQVNLIRRYTSDNVQRAYIAYDYQGMDDCPRITAQRVSGENWTGTTMIPAAEVATSFSDNGNGSHQMITPDGTIYKEFYGTGWQHGLVTSSQVLSNSIQQKLTTTSWWQADQSVNYQINPRVIETNIYDAENNRRRTTFDYSVASYAQYGLPYFASEYGANGSPEIRRTYADYNLSQAYLDQRIIGLVSAKYLYDPVTGQWKSKTTYSYDSTGISSQATTAPGHDQSYHSSFTARGNLTAISRWDADDIGNANKALTTFISYDAAGSLVSTTDPANHISSTGYADSFSDGNNSRGTFAYPTTLTDADTNSSTVQYDFSVGAKTRVQGPPPQNQANGIVQTFSYDSAARLRQVTTLNNGAYRYYEYGPNYTQAYSTVNNVSTDPHTADSYSVQVFDGLGRVFESATYHPGSNGGYKAVSYSYDAMGRLAKQSNPTEINGNWVPSNDDAAGWVYTQRTYDWKGRVLETRHLTDGSVNYANYEGCGCAGGEVVTLTDEVGRQQKIYSDALGRQFKREVLNWNGSVYATSTSTFNARDQVSLTRQYQGVEGSGVFQDTTMSYDGYGRLRTKHVPQQNAGTNTVYAYNNDDTIQSVTDARGASATYEYNNNRRLVTHISYEPGGGSPDTPDVWFGYDAVGNRISMTDGFGSKIYSYNQLSQLMSESRTFTSVGTFTLSYDYNFAGALKKITDSTGMTINYGYDSVGRLNAVTGSDNLYAGVSNYASNFQYRAWGGLKAMTDGKGFVSSLSYNSRLQPSSFQISGSVVTQSYDYFADGRINTVHNNSDQNFDRAFIYDHVGRLSEAKSGGLVNGYQYAPIPYYETFGYDAFSNLNARTSDSWGTFSDTDSTIYTNNRHDGWGYDADGRNTTLGSRTNVFDAAGRQTQMTAQQVLWNGNHINVTQTNGYDGDGLSVVETGSGGTTYHLRSTALAGGIIEELNGSGQKTVGYVSLPGGQLLAIQQPNNPTNMVTWKHNTSAGTGEYTVNTYNTAIGRTEFDPLGANISVTEPPSPPPNQGEGDIGAGHFGGIMDARWADFFNLDSGFVVDGHSVSAAEAMFYINFGTGNSLRDTAGASAEAFANSVIASAGPAAFAPAGVSVIRINVSGVEGTPGHQTIEWQWVRYNGESIFAPVPTAYSGTASMPGSVVAMAATIQGRPTISGQNAGQAAPDIAGIRNNLANALKDGDCSGFIKDLLSRVSSDANQLAAGGDLVKIFDILTGGGQGGVVRASIGGGRMDGSIGENNATILLDSVIPPPDNQLPDNRSEFLRNYQLWADSDKIIHELIHAAGLNSYSDWQLAKAVSQMPDTPELPAIELPQNPTPEQAYHFAAAMSTYWNNVLREHCKPTPKPNLRPGWKWGNP